MSRTAAQTQAAAKQGAARSNAPMLERQTTLGTHVCVQRESSGPAVNPAGPSMVRDVIGSPGHPLDASTRAAMEPRFDHDFSQVRVHTDDRAAESARAIGANAYTAGNHIAFGAGRFAPGTQGGHSLMAHELAHVVQQDSGPVAGTQVEEGFSISHPGDAFERQASGERTSAGTVPPGAQSGREAIQVQRQTGTDSTADTAAVTSATFGGISAVAGIGSFITSIVSAAAAERQAGEAEKQTKIQQEGLDVAKQALAVSENPPVPAPTTGGLVVNNNNGYVDIPATTVAEKAKDAPVNEMPVSVLKVSQGVKDFATFNAVLQSNGTNIKGGYLQDGPAQGYFGGSAASNLSLSLRGVAGPPVTIPPPVPPPEKEAPKGKKAAAKPKPKAEETKLGDTRFVISGNNIAPRSKAGSSQIQRFSGSVDVLANGTPVVDVGKISANPGTKTAGDGKSSPLVTIDLPAASPAAAAGGAVPAPPAPAPGKSDGAPAGGKPTK